MLGPSSLPSFPHSTFCQCSTFSSVSQLCFYFLPFFSFLSIPFLPIFASFHSFTTYLPYPTFISLLPFTSPLLFSPDLHIPFCYSLWTYTSHFSLAPLHTRTRTHSKAMADHHAGDAISTPTKAPSQAVSDLLGDDNDYDEVVAEDWNDMDPTFAPKPTSGSVPALLTDKEAVEIDIQAEASATGPPTLHISTIPSLLAAELADSMGLPEDVVGEEDNNPKSASSSSSEYSLLPSIISSDQSRKNSMTGISETQAMSISMTPGHTALTPEPTLLSVGRSDGDPMIGSSITSPSFSDFVQVTGNNSDFSVETSRSSSNNTPSEDVPRDNLLGEADQDQVVPTSDGSGEAVPTGALTFDIVDTPKEVPATELFLPHIVQESTQVTATTSEGPSMATPSEPSSSSTPSPLIKRMYRTTVEDSRSSEEESKDSSSTTTQELRYRGHLRDEDTRFSNVLSGTMPGGLNLGLDADISHFGTSTATPVNDPPLDERQCRICLGGVDEEDTLGRLISPCLCKGSMKYVHVEW